MHIDDDGDLPGFATARVRGLYPVDGGAGGAARRSTRSAPRCPRRSTTAPGSSSSPTATPTPTWRRSRRCCSPRGAPPPDPRATRTQVGLVVEAGDVREVHHVALLVGYGAAAVNPYLAFESVEDLPAAAWSATSSPSRPCAT